MMMIAPENLYYAANKSFYSNNNTVHNVQPGEGQSLVVPRPLFSQTELDGEFEVVIQIIVLVIASLTRLLLLFLTMRRNLVGDGRSDNSFAFRLSRRLCLE